MLTLVADDSVSKLDSMLTIPQTVPNHPDETARWQVKLETAQNVLFCKELFSQVYNGRTHICARWDNSA